MLEIRNIAYCLAVLALMQSASGLGQSGLCDEITPFYEVNLVGNPGATWTSEPPIQRDGYCCGVSGSNKCIEFEITLDPGATAITFDIIDGAIPGGALFYQLNCGPQNPVGQAVCIDSPGPHTLTFCKPGNNLNVYSITSIEDPVIPPDITMSEECSITLEVEGMIENTIQWNTVSPGFEGQYNSYLSCTTNCNLVTVTTQSGAPDYIEIEVCGIPLNAQCETGTTLCDTIGIDIYPAPVINLGPSSPIFCSTSEGVVLTSSVSGGTGNFNYSWIDPNGELIGSADSVVASIAGVYTFQLVDDNNDECAVFEESIAVNVQELPTLNAGNDVTICPTNPNIALALESSENNPVTWSGPGGYFIPSNADASTTFFPNSESLSLGGFYIQVEMAGDAVCPSIQDSLFVTVTDSLTLQIIYDPIECHGMTTNLLALAEGAQAPYSFNWNTGENNAFITGGSDVYQLVVQDQLGCELQEQVIITEPEEINIEVLSVNDSNCGQDNGKICIEVTGGTGSHTILWDGLLPFSNGCINNLVAGCYTVHVTDENGCDKEKTICINDIEGPGISIIDQKDISCHGELDGKIELNVTGMVLPLQIQWYNGNGIHLTQYDGMEVIDNLVEGSYAVQVMDNAGCEAYSSFSIHEPSSLSVFIETEETNCYGLCDGSATAYSSGGTGSHSYSWSSGDLPNSVYNTNLCAGNVILNVEDENGCSSTVSAFIEGPAELELTNVTKSEIMCFGDCSGSIDVEFSGATPPYSYQWTNVGSNLSNIENLCVGDYQLTITDANGCDSIYQWNIEQAEELVVDFTYADATCGDCNGSAELLIQGGSIPYLAEWSSGEDSFVIEGALCEGTHQVVVSDENGCAKNIEITIENISGPSVGNADMIPPSCYGENNGSILIYPTGGEISDDYQIQWSASALYQTSEIANNLTAGLHCVTVTDDNDCQVTECYEVPEPNQLQAIGSAVPTICFGEETEIFTAGLGGTAPYSIIWTNGLALDTTGMAVVTPTEDVEYCFFVQDNNGCLSQEECIMIDVGDPLTIDIVSGDVVCSGSETFINAYLGGGISSDNYNIQWFEHDLFGTIIPNELNGGISTATAFPIDSVYYYVYLQDGCSQPVYDSILITTIENPQPILSIENDWGCAPLDVLVTLESDDGISYNYDFDCDGLIDQISDSTTARYTYTVPGTYSICAMVFHPSGCFADVQLVDQVTVYPRAKAEFSAERIGEELLGQQRFKFIDHSINNTGNTWDFGDGINISGPVGLAIDQQYTDHTYGNYSNLIHTYKQAGEYWAVLHANNIFGCNGTDSIKIYVGEDFTIYAPNTFTPEGNGLNDVFMVKGYNLDDLPFEMIVFNRWGDEVFRSNDIQQGWDGVYYGEELADGIYIWQVNLTDHYGFNHQYMGHITLMR